MSLFIDVGTVLRGTVCDLYSNLVTRPTGAAVRSAIERQVVEIGTPVVTTIDFSKVNVLDFSCADEIVAKLLLRYADADGPTGYLLFRGINDSHLDPIEIVLERHALALVAFHDGFADLVGVVTDNERSHWETVRDHGPVQTDVVARMLAVDHESAERQLEQLRHRRLLMRHVDGFAVPGTVPEIA